LEGAWICCLCKTRSSRRRWLHSNEKKCLNLKFVGGFNGAIKNDTTWQYKTTLQSFICTQHKEIFFYHYLAMFKGPNFFSRAIYTWVVGLGPIENLNCQLVHNAFHSHFGFMQELFEFIA
jgi:uncharacterized membrane protein YsdA (DUF1294 family)